jgi:glyoxylase-like metal-dependent hydrolase (beta-lactamase superfamily II)
MTQHIDVDTLRDWLAAARPVTVLDVRPVPAHAEWAIPGSLHVDAAEALRSGQPGPLADIALPADRPVVTVCQAGKSSEIAAGVLTRRGFDVWSLTGGMKAWTLAWNVADVPLAAGVARVIQVRRTGKGCLSYLIGSHGEAAVIDPSIDASVYVDLARAAGWRIRHVIDTHVHADHLSRARALAAVSGATLWLPEQQRVRFAFTPLADGAVIAVGGASLTARRTAGHTDESTTLVLDGAAAFTGDTLFAESVGRPDLKADAEGTRLRARRLYASLRSLAALPPDTIILPGHASSPIAFDGRPLAARLADVTSWLDGWLQSEDGFVDRVVAQLPEPPANYARIVALNEGETDPVGAAGVDPLELEAGANRCALSAH